MKKFLLTALFLTAIISIIYSCQSADKVKQGMYYANGRDLYITHCQNCHGSKGEGLAELAPPLTDTVFLKANKRQLACFIKNGINDTTLVINGKQYRGKMPDLNVANIDIAQIIVYITNDFGNKQGMYTSEQVADDLKKCR